MPVNRVNQQKHCKLPQTHAKKDLVWQFCPRRVQTSTILTDLLTSVMHDVTGANYSDRYNYRVSITLYYGFNNLILTFRIFKALANNFNYIIRYVNYIWMGMHPWLQTRLFLDLFLLMAMNLMLSILLDPLWSTYSNSYLELWHTETNRYIKIFIYVLWLTTRMKLEPLQSILGIRQQFT